MECGGDQIGIRRLVRIHVEAIGDIDHNGDLKFPPAGNRNERHVRSYFYDRSSARERRVLRSRGYGGEKEDESTPERSGTKRSPALHDDPSCA